MTHCKDGILYRTPDGIVQQLRTVGEGIVDWERALTVLAKYSPSLHLSFEDYRAENLLRFYDPAWRSHFPDLTDADIREFEKLAEECEDRIKRKEIMGVGEYNKLPFTNRDRLESYKTGAAYLRKIIREKGF
jgi:sugar phosphate isomerase/epimerase